MATCTIEVSIRVAWWLRLYIAGLALASRLTGFQPSHDRLNYWIKKGVRVRATEVHACPANNASDDESAQYPG